MANKRTGKLVGRVLVNLLPSHREAVQRKASAMGMSESVFVRWLLTREVPIDTPDSVTVDK